MTHRRRSLVVCAAALAFAAPAALCARGQYGPGRSSTEFTHAERMREALEGRPEQQRTRAQYERVLDAYRVIYHGDPASPRADASIAAVADLLAEEGRVFQDEKALRDAIGQYEFLRREYPGTRFRYSALLTEGEIYQRDFGDLAQAKTIYLTFLRLYPGNSLATEAKAELRSIRREQARHTQGLEEARKAAQRDTRTHRDTILHAAIQSQTEVHHESERSDDRAKREQEWIAQPPPPAPANGNTEARIRSRSARRKGGLEESDIPSLLPPTQALPPSSIAVGESTGAAATDWNAPPPPPRTRLPLITGIRHWSTPVYTRVAIDLQHEVRYTAARVPAPDRLFFDLYGTRLSPELVGHSVEVTDDGFLSRIRVVQSGSNIVRIVLDVNSLSDYSAFFLSNPSRLIIDVHGRQGGPPPTRTARVTSLPPGIGIGPVEARPPVETAPIHRSAGSRSIHRDVFTDADPAAERAMEGDSAGKSALTEVAKLSHQPNEVRATARPTTGPIVSSVEGATPAPDPPDTMIKKPARISKPSAAHAADDVPPATAGAPGVAAASERAPSSMMRALGLKINRIVIDAGHGGHDSGTVGPGGLEEKDVVLDVALRLGRLLKDRLGADVTYTRSDDTFIPLETRTAIANQAQADLFISIHANSSPNTDARGVEVYYLNFTSSADALEVAARENASSTESIHQLSDLVKKIALQAKINESRDFATDVDESLFEGLEQGNPGLKDRGVKKAPFVVLIGANMPSILAEISFVTNPEDAQEMREPRYRERIATALYRGVARYVSSMNGLRVAQASTRTGSSE